MSTFFKADKGYHKYRQAKSITREDHGDLFPEAYWEYRDKWVDNPARQIVEEYPLHLGVEVTTLCNLKCTFCVRTLEIEKGTFRDIKHMSMDVFDSIVEQTSGGKVAGICLNAIGEPLMHPQIVEMVRHVKDAGGYLDTMFHTNAMLLTPELSEGLILAGLDQLIFSVDGSSKEEYERDRVGANYDTVVENDRTFHKIRTRLGSRLPIIRMTMIVRPTTTQESLDKFYKQWESIADIITFQELAEYAEKKAPCENREICSQPWQRLAVDVNGNILPCCEALVYSGKMILGNIKTDNIKDIWKGSKMEKMRSALKKHDYSKYPICKNCSIHT